MTQEEKLLLADLCTDFVAKVRAEIPGISLKKILSAVVAEIAFRNTEIRIMSEGDKKNS